MNSKLINLIKGIIVFAVAVAILLTTQKILILKSEDGISQIESFYKQKKNTVDVIFLGSSQVYCNINTGVLWDEYGMAAYDLGGAEMPSWNAYYYLKEALKTQEPKLVVVELATYALQPFDIQYHAWIKDNNYGMKWNHNRIDALKVSTTEAEFNDYLFPVGVMHSRYNDLEKNDFVDENNTINYKGFDPRETICPCDEPDIFNVTGQSEVNEKHLDYYYKIIDLCQTENIPIAIIKAPYCVTSEEQMVYNTLFAIAEEKNIPCIDFNKLYKEMNFDFSSDMADPNHTNQMGNYKYSKYLGQKIKELVDIPDHRGDSLYYSWEVDANEQRTERENADLRNTEDELEFIKKLKNPDFMSFISIGRKVAYSEGNMAEDMAHAFIDLDVDSMNLEPGGNIIVSAGSVAYQTVDEEHRIRIDNKDDSMLLVRELGGYDNEPYYCYVDINGVEHYQEGRYIDILVYNLNSGEIVTSRTLGDL